MQLLVVRQIIQLNIGTTGKGNKIKFHKHPRLNMTLPQHESESRKLAVELKSNLKRPAGYNQKEDSLFGKKSL